MAAAGCNRYAPLGQKLVHHAFGALERDVIVQIFNLNVAKVQKTVGFREVQIQIDAVRAKL